MYTNKKPLSLILAFVILAMASCSDNSCEEVSYNDVFDVSQGEVYCLPDGAQLEINELINAYCPCEAICVWEGQMMLEVVWTDAAGTVHTGQVNTHPNIEPSPLDEVPGLHIVAESGWTVEFEEECILANGNPNIISAEIMIRN